MALFFYERSLLNGSFISSSIPRPCAGVVPNIYRRSNLYMIKYKGSLQGRQQKKSFRLS